MLVTCTKDHLFDWQHHIRPVCMAYNSSVQSYTGYMSFYPMLGQQACLPMDIMYRSLYKTGNSAILWRVCQVASPQIR